MTYLLNQQFRRQVHPSHLYWPPISKETINQIPLYWLQNNDDDANTFLLSPLPWHNYEANTPWDVSYDIVFLK